MEEKDKTEFNNNGCPTTCPCLEDYPDCYCMEIINDDENNDCD